MFSKVVAATAAMPNSSEILQNTSSRERATIWWACWGLIPYVWHSLFSVTSGSSGRFSEILFSLSGVMVVGGTSVSGYILAAPGRGRLYLVVPSGRGSLVSSGTPIIPWLALPTASSSALAALFSGAAQMTNASFSPVMPSSSLRAST